jgi:hypothetical protein
MATPRYGSADGTPIPLTDYYQSKDDLQGLPQTVAEKVTVTTTPNIFSYKSHVFAKNPALVARFVKATKCDVRAGAQRLPRRAHVHVTDGHAHG